LDFAFAFALDFAFAFDLQSPDHPMIR
jgi:hypothetical protein